jgi:tetratricopeptide (TPR) repeat protein
MSLLLCSSRLWILTTLFGLFLLVGRTSAQKSSLSPDVLRELKHQNPQWLMVQPHLPDPATASPQKLEQAGDILRARRFPEDALDYYNYALRGGGKETVLLNKIGITQLELRNIDVAKLYFEQVVRLNKKDGQGWNNLGAVEYLQKHYGRAISDYGHAIKLEKRSAVFHSNLGTAFFEEKDYSNARKQFEIALQLDPDLVHHDGPSGVSAHMLSPEDHARYCFEMARLYAEHGDEINMMHYLTMASEGGFDVLREMGEDKVLVRYRKDPRVLLIVQNAQALRSGHTAVADLKGGPPQLPPAPQQ